MEHIYVGPKERIFCYSYPAHITWKSAHRPFSGYYLFLSGVIFVSSSVSCIATGNSRLPLAQEALILPLGSPILHEHYPIPLICAYCGILAGLKCCTSNSCFALPTMPVPQALQLQSGWRGGNAAGSHLYSRGGGGYECTTIPLTTTASLVSGGGFM